VQQAFLDRFSFECGYCTPGFVNAATVLIEGLSRKPVPRAGVGATVAASRSLALDVRTPLRADIGRTCNSSGHLRPKAPRRCKPGHTLK
jgi:aerobic-type carbon monoxide dehydrogenase small subunit (CoxS/CutS family)